MVFHCVNDGLELLLLFEKRIFVFLYLHIDIGIIPSNYRITVFVLLRIKKIRAGDPHCQACPA